MLCLSAGSHPNSLAWGMENLSPNSILLFEMQWGATCRLSVE